MAEYTLNSYKDFEIIWIDKHTHQPKDLNNVTFELYHYDESKPGQVIVPIHEPYIITEGFSDVLNIGSYDPITQDTVDVEVKLDLSYIATQLAGLNTPPNDYVVCGTGSKIAIVNGYLKAALSAAELAALINLGTNGEGASGYQASSQSGFLVLTGSYVGSQAFIEVGIGTLNPIIGLIQGNEYFGSDIQIIHDISPSPMARVTPGRYVYLNVFLGTPQYKVEERYFVLFRGTEPVTLEPEICEEDFTLIGIGIGSSDLNYSFTV